MDPSLFQRGWNDLDNYHPPHPYQDALDTLVALLPHRTRHELYAEMWNEARAGDGLVSIKDLNVAARQMLQRYADAA